MTDCSETEDMAEDTFIGTHSSSLNIGTSNVVSVTVLAARNLFASVTVKKRFLGLGASKIVHSPEVFVVAVLCGKDHTAKKSKIAPAGVNPNWKCEELKRNERLPLPDLPRADFVLQLSVFDSNPTSPEQASLGVATINLGSLEQGVPIDRWFPLENTNGFLQAQGSIHAILYVGRALDDSDGDGDGHAEPPPEDAEAMARAAERLAAAEAIAEEEQNRRRAYHSHVSSTRNDAKSRAELMAEEQLDKFAEDRAYQVSIKAAMAEEERARKAEAAKARAEEARAKAAEKQAQKAAYRRDKAETARVAEEARGKLAEERAVKATAKIEADAMRAAEREAAAKAKAEADRQKRDEAHAAAEAKREAMEAEEAAKLASRADAEARKRGESAAERERRIKEERRKQEQLRVAAAARRAERDAAFVAEGKAREEAELRRQEKAAAAIQAKTERAKEDQRKQEEKTAMALQKKAERIALQAAEKALKDEADERRAKAEALEKAERERVQAEKDAAERAEREAAEEKIAAWRNERRSAARSESQKREEERLIADQSARGAQERQEALMLEERRRAEGGQQKIDFSARKRAAQEREAAAAEAARKQAAEDKKEAARLQRESRNAVDADYDAEAGERILDEEDPIGDGDADTDVACSERSTRSCMAASFIIMFLVFPLVYVILIFLEYRSNGWHRFVKRLRLNLDESSTYDHRKLDAQSLQSSANFEAGAESDPSEAPNTDITIISTLGNPFTWTYTLIGISFGVIGNISPLPLNLIIIPLFQSLRLATSSRNATALAFSVHFLSTGILGFTSWCGRDVRIFVFRALLLIPPFGWAGYLVGSTSRLGLIDLTDSNSGDAEEHDRLSANLHEYLMLAMGVLLLMLAIASFVGFYTDGVNRFFCPTASGGATPGCKAAGQWIAVLLCSFVTGWIFVANIGAGIGATTFITLSVFLGVETRRALPTAIVVAGWTSLPPALVHWALLPSHVYVRLLLLIPGLWAGSAVAPWISKASGSMVDLLFFALSLSLIGALVIALAMARLNQGDDGNRVHITPAFSLSFIEALFEKGENSVNEGTDARLNGDSQLRYH